jgi:hypothetical protein
MFRIITRLAEFIFALALDDSWHLLTYLTRFDLFRLHGGSLLVEDSVKRTPNRIPYGRRGLDF